MPKYLPAAILVLLMGLFSGQARAQAITPFQTYNQSPLVQVYGLPAPPAATLLPPGKAAVRLTADVASNFTENHDPPLDPRETVLLDGETYRFDLALRYGVCERFEVGLDIPYLMHRGGFLDGFIVDWHDFFGLPQGGRNDAPKDRLEYRYTREGVDLVDLDEDAEGLGDVRLSASWQLYARGGESARAAALFASLKLPTGDSDRLLGSGSTDLALGLSAQADFTTGWGGLALYGSGGLLFMSDGEVLEDQQRNVAAFGTLGAGWSPLRRLAFKVQMDANTPFHGDSDLEEVNSPSIQLVMGGTLGFSDRTALDLGVSEDIAVDTSPDVVFHLSLRHTF